MLPAKAVMHIAQRVSWEQTAVFVCGQLNASEAQAMAGIPITEDIREPKDRVQFKKADDTLVAEIISLAIPSAFV